MKEKNKEEFQVIIENEEQNKVAYDFAKEIFGPDSIICFKPIYTKYPIRVYFYDFGREKIKRPKKTDSQKYCCGWDLISDNAQKHIPELTFEQFNQKYIMKIDESKIKRVLKSQAIKFSSEFEQKQFHLFLEEHGVKNEQRYKENTVPTLSISLARDNGNIPPRLRLDYIVLHEDQVLTTYKNFVYMCGKKIISPDEFLKLLEKPDVFMPKINGHDGEITDKGMIKYGCAEIDPRMLVNSFGDTYRGNRSIVSVELTSGTKITYDNWAEIKEYIENMDTFLEDSSHP